MNELLSTLTLAQVQALVGTDLTLVAADGRLPLRLAEVTDLGTRPPGFRAPGDAPVRRECFSLIFQGPPTPVIPQGTWRLDFPGLGEADVFLVPITTPAGLRYEAVFY